MSYLALYRQHRPKAFSQIVEQMHIVKTLSNAIELGRLSHAYLFTGPRGTGKTTIARILARSLNCQEGPTLNPCGVCASCKSIDGGTSIDVIEIDAASNRGIDDVRGLRQNLQYMSDSRYRIYIIDEVHMLTEPAFNALLKTLEEPPENSILILATTELHKVPLTILSRCQRFDFHRISPEGIFNHLKEVAQLEGIEAEDSALRAIAQRAQGGLRDALSLFDQSLSYAGNQVSLNDVLELLGSVDESTLLKAIDHLIQGSFLEIINLTAKIEDQGKDLVRFLNDLILLLKDCLSNPRAGIDLEKAELVEVLQVLIDTEMEMKRSNQPKLVLELALFRGGELLRSGGKINQLEARIKALEALINKKSSFDFFQPSQVSKEKVQRADLSKSEPKQEKVQRPDLSGSEPKQEKMQRADLSSSESKQEEEQRADLSSSEPKPEEIKRVKADFSFVPESKSIIERLQSQTKSNLPAEKEPEDQVADIAISQAGPQDEGNQPLNLLRDNWDNIMEQIYREKISLHAIFKKGVIHKIDEKELIVVYQNDFFKKVLNKPESKSLIEAVIDKKTGLNLSFKAITASEANEYLQNEINLNSASQKEQIIKEKKEQDEKENWIEQAALLFAGADKTEFVKKEKI